MKCPVCQAKLLPVDGEMFCLQCGEAVHQAASSEETPLTLEETSDPVLRRAISDATDGAVTFRDMAPLIAMAADGSANQAAKAPPKQKHSFFSLASAMMPQRPEGTSGALVLPPGAPVAVGSPAVSGVSEENLVRLVKPAKRRGFGAMGLSWAIGVVGLVVFLAANLGIGTYYANRVFPGVRVGGVAVGGWTYGDLHARLPQVLSKPALAAVVDGRHYDLDSSVFGQPAYPELEKAVKDMGHTTALPLAGIVETWLSKPLSPSYSLSDEAVARSVADIQARVQRRASNAVPMTIGSTALVIAEKPGADIDPVAAGAAIRSAYGRMATVTIAPVKVQPEIVAGAYSNDVAAAQAMIGLGVQMVVKQAKYAPTPDQIASWLVFNGPGKGVSVNGAGVAAWVASAPGSFDRASAVNAITAALNAHQPAAIAPSTAHPTANPTLPATAASWPLVSYNYCLDESKGSLPGGQVAQVLGAGGGWTLGGRVQFVRSVSGCNFVMKFGDTAARTALDPACGKQTTCRIHNDLAIAGDSWAAAPTSWSGTLASYRSELVNQVVGQWLGFDHPSCKALTTQTPVLSEPTVTVPGCSANWYAVPVELQDSKVLAGF